MTQKATRATLPVLRALLDQARHKNYTSGVLGVRARPEWAAAPTFTHRDVPVRVVPCVSALAVREALLERARDQWLIVLTDRPEEDLGTGVLSHFLWHRLRTPDPWDAVRERFAATGIDPSLTAATNDRDVATGLLAAAPAYGWPPAPGGVLTRDHAFGAVAAVHLGLTDPVVDAASVLAWTTDPRLATSVADLRALAGDALTDVALDWAAGRAGSAAQPLRALLRGGEGGDAVPLGLIAGLLGGIRDAAEAEPRLLAREALIRLEPRLGGTVPASPVLRSWAAEAAAVVTAMLQDPANHAAGTALLLRADELLAALRAAGLADGSDLLPAGLTRRLASLAATLRSAVSAPPDTNPDGCHVPAEALAEAEQAWARVATHRLADADERTPAFHAAVRLIRWLAVESPAGDTSLASLLGRHRDQDAWVDSAVNDAAPGVSDPDLAAGLAAVLTTARARRAAHDTAFAAALAAHTSSDPAADAGRHAGVRHIEDLLLDLVLPLARRAPVLLLVLDGMSAGVGTEVVNDVLRRAGNGWAEALLPGETRRMAALAALPTLTEVSRASLLCGSLRTGGQDIELNGYKTLADAHGVQGVLLFHKRPLDSSRLGYAVADDVAAAIADVTGHPLVTCILNTIDDALDRSDPGGTDWTADAVKHLLPLLDQARRAGRVVILTADHGHVIERRQGSQRPHAAISSSRSRGAAEPAGEGEVLVTGNRVLLHDGTAVLAVDENLRYGPLKAGYHGGASPAEALIPVAVLVSGAVPEGAELSLAPPQEPSWWIDPAEPATSAMPAPAPSRPTGAPRPAAELKTRMPHEAPTLFDEASEMPQGAASELPVARAVGAAVVSSAAYAAQKRIADRVSVTDEQVATLLDALLAAPSHRLTPPPAASALQVSLLMLRGAVLHAQRLLNVEGYPVLRIDADGTTLILDVTLLREQFEVRL